MSLFSSHFFVISVHCSPGLLLLWKHQPSGQRLLPLPRHPATNNRETEEADRELTGFEGFCL